MSFWNSPPTTNGSSFVAPGSTNAYGTAGEPSVNGLGDSTATAGTPSTPTAPDPTKAALTALQRTGWIAVSSTGPSDQVILRGGQGVAPPGSQRVVIAGPNGQSDSMILGPDGSVVEPPAKNAEKPSATDVAPSAPKDWVPITDPAGNPIAMQDPKTGKSLDIPKATQPRVDSPAETQNAASAAQNANTAAAAQANTAAHENRSDANASRLADLQAEKDKADANLRQEQIDFNNKTADLQAKKDAGELSLAEAKLEFDKIHAQATDAQSAATLAETRWRDEQTAQNNSGQLANSQAQTTESTRANTARETETTRANHATETQNAANMLRQQMADDQASRDRQAQIGQGLIDTNARAQTAAMANFTGMATSSKNFGLGGPLPANMGANTVAGAQQLGAAAIGGPDMLQKATDMVNKANPSLSGTPQGATYSALLQQMLEAQQPQAPGAPPLTAPGAAPTAAPAPAPAPSSPPPATNPSMDDATTRLSANFGNGAGFSGNPSNPTPDPSDPNYLGTVIGQAVAHIGQFTAPGGA